MGKVNEFQNLIEKTVDSSEVFAGEMLHVYRDNIELPNGKMDMLLSLAITGGDYE